MSASTAKIRKPILVLQPIDEVREPFEVALVPFAEKVIWLSSYNHMLEEIDRESPSVVILDLDCLDLPYDFQLQQLRSLLPETDIIVISGSDSAQLALQTIRNGCNDFLLKPVSPEELAWCVRKSQQKQEVFHQLIPADPNTGLLKAITQISSYNAAPLVQMYSLEYLRAFLKAEGAAWVSVNLDTPSQSTILSSCPKKLEPASILSLVPFKKLQAPMTEPLSLRSKTPSKQKLFIPCRDFPSNGIFVWNIKQPLTPKIVSSASLLVEHSDLSLINIQKYEELKQQTFIDDLTGLYNARYLKYAVTNAILKCKKPGQCFSILFIDVDHFKKVNDGNGHLVGSEFLVAIGRTVNHAVRNIDQVFRYGGDEFVVILQGANTEEAKEIAERIRKNIERRVFVIHGKRLQSTVSIGIATFPDHAAERDALLRLADEAMYSVKKNSRNAVHLALGLDQAKAVPEKDLSN